MNHNYEYSNDSSNYSNESPKFKTYNKLKKYYEQKEAKGKKGKEKFNKKGRNNNGNLYLKNTYEINNFFSSNSSNLNFEGIINKEGTNKKAILRDIENNQSYYIKTIPDLKYVNPANDKHQKNLNLTPIPYLSENNTLDENKKKEFYELRKKIVNTRMMEYTHSYSSIPLEEKNSNKNKEDYVVRHNLLNDKKENKNDTEKIDSYSYWEELVKKEKDNFKINNNETDNINGNKKQKLSIKNEYWNIKGTKAKIFTHLLHQNCINLNIINDNDNDLYLINHCKPVSQCCFISKEKQKKELSYLIQKFNQINANMFNNDNNYFKVKKKDSSNKFYLNQKIIKNSSGSLYDKLIKNKIDLNKNNILINNNKNNSQISINNNDINMSYSNTNSDKNILSSFPDSLENNNINIKTKKIFKNCLNRNYYFKKIRYKNLDKIFYYIRMIQVHICKFLKDKVNNNCIDSDLYSYFNNNDVREKNKSSLLRAINNYRNDIYVNKLKILESLLEKNNQKLNKEINDNYNSYNKTREKMNNIIKITKNKLPMKIVKIIKSHLKCFLKDIYQYDKNKNE